MSRICVLFACVIVLISVSTVASRETPLRRNIKCTPQAIPNALYSLRKRDTVMRIICAPGYILYGTKTVECVHGKWDAVMPVCAKKGCQGKPEAPEKGIVHIEDDMKAILFCKENYKVAGGRVAYCNGSNWDRPLGTCREMRTSTQLGCDFESDDICGWAHDEFSSLTWKRAMAVNMFLSMRTGPQHDHSTGTANGGHYMLMESFGPRTNAIAQLISPIYSRDLSLKTACCFRFFYFMYGATVGTLNVYVRPMSVDRDTMISDPKYLYFTKGGNQNNIWNEAVFDIEEMPDDFQIYFVGTGGKSHLSDIAIDDVQLMTGQKCPSAQYQREQHRGIENKPTTPSSSSSEDNEDDREQQVTTQATDSAIYDVQSCESRCSETHPTGYGIVIKNGLFFKSCDCHPECEESKSCCPNYQAICVFADDNTTGPAEDANVTYVVDENENKNGHSYVTMPTTTTTNATAIYNRMGTTEPTTTTTTTTAATPSTTKKTPTTTTTTKTTPAQRKANILTTIPSTTRTAATKTTTTTTTTTAAATTTTTTTTTAPKTTTPKRTTAKTRPTTRLTTPAITTTTTTTGKPKTTKRKTLLRTTPTTTTTARLPFSKTVRTKPTTKTPTTTTVNAGGRGMTYTSNTQEQQHQQQQMPFYSITENHKSADEQELALDVTSSKQQPNETPRTRVAVWTVNRENQRRRNGHSALLVIMEVLSVISVVAILLGAIYHRCLSSRDGDGENCLGIGCGRCRSAGTGGGRDGRKSVLANSLRIIFHNRNSCMSNSSYNSSEFQDTTSLIYNSHQEDEILLQASASTDSIPISTL